MDTYHFINEPLDANFHKRMMRVTLGLGAIGLALTRYKADPLGIFLLSTISIYLMISAIIGRGVLDIVLKGVRSQTRKASVSHALNLQAPERVVRGITAGVALGSVVSSTFVLNPLDFFALNLAGFFFATTAAIAWCPIVGLFQYLYNRISETVTTEMQPSMPAASPTVVDVVKIQEAATPVKKAA